MKKLFFAKPNSEPSILTLPMTSDNAPYPQVASASSMYTQQNPFRAFDQKQGNTNITACWASANGSFPSPDFIGNQWLQIDMGSVKTIRNYVIRHRGYGNTLEVAQFPVDIGLAVSNNGTDFTTVDTRTGLAAPTAFYQPYAFTLPSAASGRYVRLLITKARSGLASIGELELYG